jgi:hypothetical protein
MPSCGRATPGRTEATWPEQLDPPAGNEGFGNVTNVMTMTGIIRLCGAIVCAALLAACAAQTTQPEVPEQAEKSYSFEPWEGDGMEIPLDGSSLEAFDTSLARVEAHTSPENYTTLLNAIEYLLFYDLSAGRDRTRLASNLDGLTPNEVIAKVHWQKPAEKGGTADTGGSDPAIEL